MKDEILKKIEFEGTNIVSLGGVGAMCINKNEIDSIFNELPQRLFFINGRIKVTVYEKILLEHNIQFDFSEASFWKWTVINPYDVPSFRGIKNVHKWFSKKIEKTISLYGFFMLEARHYTKNKEVDTQFSLHAANSAYMYYELKNGEDKRESLTPNFYCTIKEENLNIDIEKKALFPPSTIACRADAKYEDYLFYLESDIIEMFERERFSYSCIAPDQVVIDGEAIELPNNLPNPVPAEEKEIHISREKTLLNIIGGLLVILRGKRNRHFNSIAQLTEYFKDEYNSVQGLGENVFHKEASKGLHSLLDEMEDKHTGTKEQLDFIRSLIKQK